MKSLNNPILGDDTYGSSSKFADRQMLHAYSLEFTHPITNKIIKVIGDIPEDFISVLKNLHLDINKIKTLDILGDINE